MKKLGSALAGAAVGTMFEKAKDKVSTPQHRKEWLRPWMTAPVMLAYVGVQKLAYELFGHNEKLLTHVAVAPTVAFIGATLSAAVIDRVFKNHEVAEKVAMVMAGGAVALGATYVSLAANGHEGLSGMQPGDIMAAPGGEIFLAASAAAGATAMGTVMGEALHQDKLPPRRS